MMNRFQKANAARKTKSGGKGGGGARPGSGPKPSADRCPCGCGMTRGRGLQRHPAKVAALTAGKEIDALVLGLKARATMPRGFGLWSPAFQIGWLRANQKKGGK